MDNPFADIRGPEDARAALADWKERADRRASDAIAASEAVQAVTAVGADGNGIVNVKLDSSGAILQVAFSPEVRRMQPNHLERQFMQAYGNAGQALLEAAKAAVAQRLSPDSPTAKALVDSIEMRFPEREAEG
ncbi:YbaB/EbfC family nucleoid-associated protein [Glycomyces tenuis]|uniref:YbaB/EbfC family nucleoid-associated protein n=1 Tax=Glycomyces tenuis TaxID=58116 RepID=UPI00040A356B|nr:YbaB/EbfC family nucleoid-associated protein [Glycomyces tenuis]